MAKPKTKLQPLFLHMDALFKAQWDKAVGEFRDGKDEVEFSFGVAKMRLWDRKDNDNRETMRMSMDEFGTVLRGMVVAGASMALTGVANSVAATAGFALTDVEDDEEMPEVARLDRSVPPPGWERTSDPRVYTNAEQRSTATHDAAWSSHVSDFDPPGLEVRWLGRGKGYGVFLFGRYERALLRAQTDVVALELAWKFYWLCVDAANLSDECSELAAGFTVDDAAVWPGMLSWSKEQVEGAIRDMREVLDACRRS